MKLYITNTNEDVDGYTCISPVKGINIREIPDDVCADSEATEIICKTIDYIPVQFLVPSLQNYKRKLRKGGRITIIGTDLYLSTLAIARREMSPIESNVLLYGGPEAHMCKSCLAGINDVAGILEEMNLTILKKSLDGFTYTVEAQRNG